MTESLLRRMCSEVPGLTRCSLAMQLGPLSYLTSVRVVVVIRQHLRPSGLLFFGFAGDREEGERDHGVQTRGVQTT